MPGLDAYSLEDAERDIGTLRGQADRLSEVLTKNDSTDPPNTPAAGLIHYSSSGHHKYASADGGTYNTGRSTVFITATQTINSTSEAVVGTNSVPLTWNVVPGKYLMYAEVTYIPNVNADSACLRLSALASGMTVSSLRANFKQYNSTGVVSVNNNAVTALASDMQSSTMVSATTAHFEFWAPFTVSAGGTISVTARILTTNTNTYVIQLGTFAFLMPVT